VKKYKKEVKKGLVKAMNNKIIRMKKQIKLSGRILSKWWKCWLVRYVDVRKE